MDKKSMQTTLFPPDFDIDNNMTGSIPDILTVFRRPIIVMPSQEKVPLPDDIKSRITIERLILAMKNEKRASDTECMWYLSTVSLCQPIKSEWFRIYQKLFTDWCIDEKKELPDFAKENHRLSDYEKDLLNKLSLWIYNQGMNALNHPKKGRI